ncbi:MAG: gliding motility-associated C-terminal domain-containing protein [Chitinophagaceae bacterium]|nr:gliding motility-associated C-terminal domain-containing protein [Chitinophagaceae bacterium]
MQKFYCLGLLIVLGFIVRPVHAQTFSPVIVTGFDQDVVAEGGPSTLATTTRELDAVASNKVMYTDAFRLFAGIAGGGIPDNGTIVNGNMTFKLGSYTANNALCVFRNETKSLSLASPASFAKIRILCFATEANVISGSLINISLTFSDATTVQYITNYNLGDWFNGTTNTVLTGFGRCSRVATAPWGDEAYPSNPRMYYIEITPTCTDAQKQLQQITFSNVTTSGSNAPFPNDVILAVSGVSYSQTVADVITPCDCAGPNGSIALTVSGSSSPYTYSWNTTPVQNGATATGLAPGTYTCTITDANGCTAPYTGTVTLNNNAAMNATATPASVCPGGSAQLSANVTTGTLTTYTWTPGSLTGQTVTVNPAGTATYTVNASNALGCTASAQVTVTMNPVPAAPVVNNVTICSGSNTVLQVQSPLPGYIYNWYDLAAGGTLLNTGTAYSLTNVTATATYYVEAVNATNCNSNTRTPVTVTVQQPVAPQSADVTICRGTDATLTVLNPQAGFTYNWFTAATGGTAVATGTSYTATAVNAPVVYYIDAVTSLGCISPTRTAVNITLYPVMTEPVVTVTNVSFTAITFSWAPVPGAVGYQVSTNGGGSFQSPSSGATGTTHTISGLAGNTTIVLVVKALGPLPCQNSFWSEPISGTTLSTKEIFVPNVFTPNGDGKNDVLKVYGNYLASMRFSIFNQWGELIFVSTNLNTGWDGTYKNKAQPVGVYAYTLKVTRQDGTVVEKKGAVNLIR